MRPGRNEHCPCGSGRKYKHCCGSMAAGCGEARAPTVTAAVRFAEAHAHYQVALRLERQDDLERAVASYERATELLPEFAEAHNDLAQVLLRLGRVDAAIERCRRALALRPQFVEAVGNLANAERARGDLSSAIAGYRRVIELAPDLAEAHGNLGSALLESMNAHDAVPALRRAIELKPDHTGALLSLARALAVIGRRDEAISCHQRLHAIAARPVAPLEHASLLVAATRWTDAAKVLREAVSRATGNAPVHATLAHVLLALGDHRGAIAHGRQAVALDPGIPEAHLNLGNALLAVSEVHAAQAAYQAGLEAVPDHVALLLALAMAERALGQIDAAETLVRRALGTERGVVASPGRAEALALLGSLAGDRGRFADAESHLLEALATNPLLPEALVAWTRFRRMTKSDATWHDAATRALAAGPPVAQAIGLEHALGKYYDDLGQFGNAFAHHRRGNELARRTHPPYDRAETTARVSRTLATFDRAALAALCVHGMPSTRPVFVVGMPRSGTSLVEQILASHPNVRGAGELLYWNFAADVERTASPERRAATITALATDYLAHLASLATGADRVVDKLPGNIENLGLIHAALPCARIILCERDPRDVGLSIYCQGFSHAHAYATDFGDIAHHYREYRRLVAHWRSVLPARALFEVRYESLIEDPQTWTRRLLEHIDMPWDPRCLEFHRTDRPVLTASTWQVRQPISRGAVGRWRHYAPYLGSLIDALEPAGGGGFPPGGH